MPHTPDRLERFARHIVLPEIGGVGQAALANAHVALVGIGGIGSPALQAIRVLLHPNGGLGNPQWGKLHVLDGLEPSLKTMTIAKDPACRGCGTGGG
jgi:molybdopterin/thiamine biosynthesis adenylyltransferase